MKNNFRLLIFITITILFVNCHTKNDNQNVQVDPIVAMTEKINADPNNPTLYNLRAKAYLNANQINNALEDINKAIQLNPKKSELYITLSDIYLAMTKVENCNDALNKALALDPQSTEALVKLAELNLYLKQYEEVHKFADKAIEIDNLKAKAYFVKGLSYKESGDTTSAVKYYMKTVEVNPEYYDAYMQLGLLFSLRKSKNALDFFNSAINLKPKSIEAHYALGMYYQESDKYDAALKSYENIIQINPKYKEAYFNSGYIYLIHLNKYDLAIKNFTDAITADSSYYEAYYNRGLSYEMIKDYTKAKKDFKTATELKTNFQLAIDGLNRLDKLR